MHIHKGYSISIRTELQLSLHQIIISCFTSNEKKKIGMHLKLLTKYYQAKSTNDKGLKYINLIKDTV